MNFKIILLIILSFLFFVACKTETNNCIEILQARITTTKTPSIGYKNLAVPITIKYGINNGCGKFYNMSETEQGNTRTILVNAKYEGCVCTMIASEFETNYYFTSKNVGTYYLKFMKNNTEFHVDTITIQ